MSAALSIPLPPTTESQGRYQVGRQLAAGGMGTIHHAFDALARREVAYKRLQVTSERARPRMTALFEREYNALRQLKHPNIVEVYDYGLDAEGPYYTMELLTGNDLAAAAPLPFVEACRILRDVASALALLHARRLVHRDVTPANVRLAPDGRAKLLDFGALSEFGVAKEIVGTPAFIAPESLAGAPLDARTDLFALGGLAYWALTRRQAYAARSIDDLLDAWERPIAVPSYHVPELPKELDELVMSLLERDAVARPSSAAHVIERLTAIADLPPEQDEAKVAYSYLMHPPLVGRDQPLEQLRRFAAEAVNGQGRSVLIESAPGLGRSAVLDQLATDAQLSGVQVLRFQPSGKRDAGLAHSILRWARALFPEVATEIIARHPVLTRETRAPRRAAPSPGAPDSGAKLVSAMQACIEEMSKRAPLALLIDDVHRADPESLALLASLARIVPQSTVLLIATQEERAVGSDVAALSDLQAASTPLALRPLSEGDVETLLQAVFGEVDNAHRLARFLHAQSGGNPGQCMDICRLLLSKHEVRYALGTFTLPFDPRSEMLGDRGMLELTRVSELSAQDLLLVRLMSLHDASLSCAQAASALSLGLEQVLASTQTLSARGLVQTADAELSLTSQSLRAAVRASLSASERTALHLALGKALRESSDGSLESRFAACHHLLCADQEDEGFALVWDFLRNGVFSHAGTTACVPVLEQMLAILRKRGHPDEHCTAILGPLVSAGFYGNLVAQNRHLEAALNALANLTGLALARRLTPRLGKKLALIVGMLAGIFRFLRTPKRFRPPTYALAVQRFVTVVTVSTASVASASEPETALRIAAFLDPFDAMKEGTAGRVAREFALATAEIAIGLNARSAQRYAWILAQLEKFKNLFDGTSQESYQDGCLHGLAQAEVASGATNALETAEQLARRHPFYGPHVENIRMSYHGYRGESELAAAHRKRGELLALQGGLSWSAFTVLSIRSAYIAMVSEDTLGVIQAGVALQRLSAIAPNMRRYSELCRAYVAMAQGRPEEAVQLYERIAASPHAHLMPTLEVDRAFYAEALMRVGKLEEARNVCSEAIQLRREQGADDYSLRVPIQVLALIEAKLGNVARAKQLLADLLSAVLPSEGPLQIGAVYREQARVALIERDAVGFDRHFDAMIERFRATNNPVLIQQCRRLLAEATKSGVVATPNWEKHRLMPPANTQQMFSEMPDRTELLETYS